MRPKVKLSLILNCCLFCIVNIILTQNVWSDDKKLTDKAELSFVQSSGNTEATTLNGKNTLKYNFSKNVSAQWKASAFYGERKNEEITEEGVEKGTEKYAEKYATELRGDHTFYKHYYYYLITGWKQDKFAGLDDRYFVGPGLGYKMPIGERHTLSMEVGVNYAKEDYIDATDNEFLEGRGFANYTFKLNSKVEFSEEVEYLKNFKEGPEYTIGSTTAIKSKLNSWLDLKVSYEVNYNNQPIPETLEYIDALLSVALVVNI